MPRGFPNKKPAKWRRIPDEKPRAKRGRPPAAVAFVHGKRQTPAPISILSVIAKAMSDIAAERGAMFDADAVATNDPRQPPIASIQQGPTLALLQERLGITIDQAKKQFTLLSQIADRICGPGTHPIGDAATSASSPGGMMTELNSQMNTIDQIMARIDDQIVRLESL